MIKRYDLDLLMRKVKTTIKYYILTLVIFGILIVISIILDMEILGIISSVFLCVAMIIGAIKLSFDSNKIEEEKEYRLLENFIEEFDDEEYNCKLLYKMYLDDRFTNEFNGITVYPFPNTDCCSFELNLIKDNDTIVFLFDNDEIRYCKLKAKDYIFGDNVNWVEIKQLFNNETEILDFVKEIYNNL